MSPSLLLAGFGAFPGAPTNPSERLMRRLRDEKSPSDASCATLVLPVEWERAWQVLEAKIKVERPSAVLIFGLHARAGRLRIETMAANRRDPDRPDAAGASAPSPLIRSGGPSALEASLPLDAILAELTRAGIDHELSHDAGGYLCNETLFLLAHSAGKLGLRRFGFIHTPFTDECDRAGADGTASTPDVRLIPAATLIRAARIAIACIAADIERPALAT